MAKGKIKRLKKKGILTLIGILVVIVAVISCVISFILTQSSLSEMQTELEALQIKTQEVEAENVELQRILDDEHMNAYMEKLAIEEMNYAYPNERRYYDKSRN